MAETIIIFMRSSMAVDELRGLHAKPTFIGKYGPWLLTLPSALVGILLVELFCWLFVPSIGSNIPGRDRRVFFFDGIAPIFENHQDIFNYLPHNEIRNVTAFLTDTDYGIEYDYRFRTNNFGLAQDADIVPERTSMLLLGDSFTEGQGAEPWFPLVGPAIDKLGYQPINGGVLGTGFGQWLKLAQYLAAKNIQILKVLVIFISDDFHRPVWNIPPDVFACLSASPHCHVENSVFYRLPPPGGMSSWIATVRTARGRTRPRLELHASALLPASFSIYSYFKQLILFAKGEQQSRAAIAGLVQNYGSANVAFLHLPQKDEVEHGPDSLGMKARRAILDAGGRLFDGFSLCHLTGKDYYPHDDHPNKGGYDKIAACAEQAINQLAADGR